MRPPDQLPLHSPPAPEELRLRVLASARDRPAPRRTDRLVPILVRVALAAIVMVAVVMLFPSGSEPMGLAHAAPRPAVTGAWVLAGAIALAIAATWLTLPARRSMLSPARGQLLAVAIGVPVLVLAWLWLWYPTYADPAQVMGWRCLGLTALTAPWPFLVLTYVGRRLDPRNPIQAGAALGATAGAWAAVMVELWCPRAEPHHVLFGHVLPLVLLTVGGAIYGAFRLGLRRIK